MKATCRAHWHASYSLNQQSGCFSVKTLTFYLDSPFNTMYKHSHQSIQDLLSLHSAFHSFTATDGQLSQLWYFFKARVIVWIRSSRQTDTHTPNSHCGDYSKTLTEVLYWHKYGRKNPPSKCEYQRNICWLSKVGQR